MKSWRSWVLLGGLVLSLGLVNYNIADMRAVIASGRPLLLELRPVDPRSLMQGDYMALEFAEDSRPTAEVTAMLDFRGTVILKLDENGIGRFARLDDGGALGPGEMRIRYRRYKEWTNERIAYTARSFLFQEGLADRYERAKFAVLRVDESGASVLVDLADENRNPLSVGVSPATP